MQAKNIVITVLLLALLIALFFLFKGETTEVTSPAEPTQNEDVMLVEPDGGIGDGAGPLPAEPAMADRGDESTLGSSVSGSAITAHHFGDGAKEVLLLGGVHGSYSPNTTTLANQLVAYFEDNEDVVPENVTLTIVPLLNPDGAATGGTAGRFNANDVDLNRNFDCEWSATGVWRDQEVSGGSAPFSEPEAAALRDYINTYDPAAAVVWFGAEGKVYPSACADTPDRSSVTLAATFANAAGYPAEAEFDAYAITGDMVNWMAAQEVPAISVLLSDRESAEFNKNLAGITAVLETLTE